LVAGLFSRLLGVDLPGPGSNYLKQQMEFPSSAAVGEELRALVQITSIRPEKRLVYLTTTCLGADDRVVCRGQALVLAGGIPPGEHR
jgi:acyl dehydratase